MISRRAIYFCVAFLLPLLAAVFDIVAVATQPLSDILVGVFVGTGFFSAFCVLAGLIGLNSDASA